MAQLVAHKFWELGAAGSSPATPTITFITGGNNMYSNSLKLMMLCNRRNILVARGPHNAHLVAKLDRQIRRLEK